MFHFHTKNCKKKIDKWQNWQKSLNCYIGFLEIFAKNVNVVYNFKRKSFNYLIAGTLEKKQKKNIKKLIISFGITCVQVEWKQTLKKAIIMLILMLPLGIINIIFAELSQLHNTFTILTKYTIFPFKGNGKNLFSSINSFCQRVTISIAVRCLVNVG